MQMRIALEIEYNGNNYAGWQRQQNAVAVQQIIEETLANIIGEQVCIHGSGRTDAGVHALGQVAHFDAETPIPASRISHVLNQKLPKDISISRSWQVADTFHARYDAVSKIYRYDIYTARQRSALRDGFAMRVPVALDVQGMQKAASYIVGKHDFASFSGHKTTARTTVREVFGLSVQQQQNEEIRLEIRGDGFLFNMVRIIAGTLVEVGQQKRSPQSIESLLRAKDRQLAGITAPAQGLYLVQVFYE